MIVCVACILIKAYFGFILLKLKFQKKEMSFPQGIGCEIVVKYENNVDSSEVNQSLKLYEEWALNYKRTFLSPQEFSSTSKHFKLNDAVIKEESAIKEESVSVDDSAISSHSENFDFDNAEKCKEKNEKFLLHDNSEEIVYASRNQNSKNNHTELS